MNGIYCQILPIARFGQQNIQDIDFLFQILSYALETRAFEDFDNKRVDLCTKLNRLSLHEENRRI